MCTMDEEHPITNLEMVEKAGQQAIVLLTSVDTLLMRRYKPEEAQVFYEKVRPVYEQFATTMKKEGFTSFDVLSFLTFALTVDFEQAVKEWKEMLDSRIIIS